MCSVDIPEPRQSARDAGLLYVHVDRPGITRHRAGTGFFYRDPDGERITDAEALHRIRALAIPPAWEEVWICPVANGHIQATGRDGRNRKQYRYHPEWRNVRDTAKYEHMIAFGNALPRIRKQVDADLRKHGLPKEKILAAIVRLLETTLIRVGSDEYARENQSFGLTTMRDRHARISGTTVTFSFRGKSGIRHDVELHDRRLANVIKRSQDLPGQELLQYVDDEGAHQGINSEDVNAYLKAISDEDFTAKDFRTWAGTLLAAEALASFQDVDSDAAAKHNVVQAIEHVAARLGNTPAICRKCYVHPAIIDAYLDGETVSTIRQRTSDELATGIGDLPPEEAAVLMLLHQRLK